MGHFDPVSLSAVGDRLSLSARYRQIDNVPGGMRFGLFDSEGTPTDADNDGSSDDDDGYYLNIGTPGPTGNGETRLMKQTGDVDPVLTSGEDLGEVMASGFHFNNRLVHEVSFSIERTGGDQLRLQGNWTGSSAGGQILRVIEGDLVTDFDQIAIGFGSAGSGAPRFRLDDIRLTFSTVPVVLTDFEKSGEGEFVLEFKGASLGDYQLKGTNDLSFEESEAVVIDSVEVGEAVNANTIRTDDRGRARVRFRPTSPRQFVRVESATP